MIKSRDAFKRWWNTFPAHRRIRRGNSKLEYDSAIYRIRDENEMTTEQAMAFLQKRTEVFAKSPTGRGEFCSASDKWLHESRWDDADAAWGIVRRCHVVQVTPKRIDDAGEERYALELERLYGADLDDLDEADVYKMLPAPLHRKFREEGKRSPLVRECLLERLHAHNRGEEF